MGATLTKINCMPQIYIVAHTHSDTHYILHKANKYNTQKKTHYRFGHDLESADTVLSIDRICNIISVIDILLILFTFLDDKFCL